MTTRKIGILTGGEWSWPPAFIEEVNHRNAGAIAEMIKLGGTRMADACDYDVIVDRISHEVPYYRIFLKNAMLSGTTVINNPLWSSCDDRFFGASLATRLNIPHPRTVALPSHSYKDSVRESLHNLVYPIPWEDHINYLGGFPVTLRPVWDGIFKRTYILNSLEELWHSYNETGTECTILQEYIGWEKYVRCICIGSEHIVIRCDPDAAITARYRHDDTYLTDEERDDVSNSAWKLNRALGYDVNALEFGLHQGIWYATDFTNPVPDFDVNSITPLYFDWVVKTMVDMVIELAKNRKPVSREFSWNRLLNTGRTAAAEKRVRLSRKKSPER